MSLCKKQVLSKEIRAETCHGAAVLLGIKAAAIEGCSSVFESWLWYWPDPDFELQFPLSVERGKKNDSPQDVSKKEIIFPLVFILISLSFLHCIAFTFNNVDYLHKKERKDRRKEKKKEGRETKRKERKERYLLLLSETTSYRQFTIEKS